MKCKASILENQLSFYRQKTQGSKGAHPNSKEFSVFKIAFYQRSTAKFQKRRLLFWELAGIEPRHMQILTFR